jgi:GT2 family glycosyltransferase
MPDSRLDQVTVICVTYQSESIIDSLGATLEAFPHVVIVDNGSSDTTTARIGQRIPHARLIGRRDNIGFGAANNEAMAQVRTPFALLLNPDSSIDPPNLAILMDTLDRHPDAAAAAPQNWRSDGEPQRSFRQAFYKIRGKKGRYETAQATCCADWLHGSCLLLRTDTFRRIGGFDESFFLYYEDDDLCLRLQKAGHACLFEPRANARHIGAASSTAQARTHFLKSFHYARSRHIALDKYVGRHAGNLYLAKILAAALPAALLYAILLQPRYAIRWAAWGCAAMTGFAQRAAGTMRKIANKQLLP